MTNRDRWRRRVPEGAERDVAALKAVRMRVRGASKALIARTLGHSITTIDALLAESAPHVVIRKPNDTTERKG